MVRVFWTGRGELHRYRLASDFADMVRVFEKPALSEFYYFRDGGAWKKKPL